MRACDVVGPLTTQLYEPLLAEVVVKVVMGANVAPPSRLRSIWTTWPVPRLWLKLRLCVVPTDHLTFVFGDVTLTNGAAIVKLTLLVSLIAAFAEALTRIRACVVAGPVTTQL